MKQALEVQAITKRYKQTKKADLIAVDNLSLSVPEGSIYGLLGPNGAGKSTLINMIGGVTKPTSGRIRIFGVDNQQHPIQTRKMLGVVPQEITQESIFTVEEVLYYFSGMYGLSHARRKQRIEQVLEELGLADKLKQRAYQLSGGMKRRLMIAKAILHEPRFVILDEPTAGVDVALRQRIWDLIVQMNRNGTTILFTTHYLEEAEQLCDELTIIDHGQIVGAGSLKDFQRNFEQGVIYFELYHPQERNIDGVERVGTEFEYHSRELLPGLAKLCKHYGSNLKSVRSEHASLEKIFLELTGLNGHKTDDAATSASEKGGD